jgi:hypothetical protein
VPGNLRIVASRQFATVPGHLGDSWQGLADGDGDGSSRHGGLPHRMCLPNLDDGAKAIVLFT